MIALVTTLGLAGVLFVGLGLVSRRRERRATMALLLDEPLDRGNHEAVDRYVSAMLETGVGAVQSGIGRLDPQERLRLTLEGARLPLRPAEFVLLVLATTAGVGSVVAMLAGSFLLGAIVAAFVPVAGWQWVGRKVEARRRAVEAQLPDMLTLVGSSLQAGHSFLRSVQIYAQEAEAPMSEEIERVLAETQLGDPLMDALERMAERVGLDDLDWVVEAIRIQQQVGGGLAELFFTLAEFMRSREEVRLETRALTADARISAWVLGLLPLFMVVVLQVAGGGYLDPMFRGGGLIALGIAGLMAAGGAALIMRMARVEV